MICSECYDLVGWINTPTPEAITPSFNWKTPSQLLRDDAFQHCDLCNMFAQALFAPRPHLPPVDFDLLMPDKPIRPVLDSNHSEPTKSFYGDKAEVCEILALAFIRPACNSGRQQRIRVWREPLANTDKAVSTDRLREMDMFVAQRCDRIRALEMYERYGLDDRPEAPLGQRIKAYATDTRQLANLVLKEYKYFWTELRQLSDVSGHEKAARFIGPPWRKPILDNTGPEAVAQMTSWLRECVNNHPLCRIGISSHRFEQGSEAPFLDQARLPSRVLDVGLTDMGLVKLVETTPDTPSASYVALSHCWGPPDKRPLRTTLETLQHHIHHGIPHSRLPKTFADAATITRSLGIRYLWIDSLCIVQDDEADWATESERMGSIYEGATLTLAAAHARDSSEGFFVTQRPDPNEVVKVVTTPTEGDRAPFLTGFVPDSTIEGEGYAWKDTPLSRRGWVMQEWHLSRRVLWSEKKSFMWKCRTANLCEQEGTNTELPSYNWNEQLDWITAIMDYSRKGLTYEKDRLIALRGMASSLGKSVRRRGQEFHFGMWIGGADTPHTLLWRPETPCRADSAESRQGIPTWSWASLPGPKAYPLDVWAHKVIDQVRGISAARGGTELRLRAPICQLRLFSWLNRSASHDERKVQVRIHPEDTCYDTHDAQRQRAERSYTQQFTCCDAAIGDAHLDCESDVHSCSPDPGMPCYAIFLLRQTRYGFREVYQSYELLLVKPTVTNMGTKAYRRVGTGSITVDDGNDPFFSKTTFLRKKKSCTIPVEDIVLI